MSEAGVHREGHADGSAIDRQSGRRRSDRVVGAARGTQEAVDQAMAMARSDRPILITGPSGSGKEHLARAIHAWSARAASPFTIVSCASVAPGLLGRELFGCSESAHPKLGEEYAGALSRANTGTVLLNSIDQLPAALAEQLARAIAEGRYQREGDGAVQQLRARPAAGRSS